MTLPFGTRTPERPFPSTSSFNEFFECGAVGYPTLVEQKGVPCVPQASNIGPKHSLFALWTETRASLWHFLGLVEPGLFAAQGFRVQGEAVNHRVESSASEPLPLFRTILVRLLDRDETFQVTSPFTKSVGNTVGLRHQKIRFGSFGSIHVCHGRFRHGLVTNLIRALYQQCKGSH